MINLPILRWGQPYTSMELDEVVHFSTGEPIARVSRATGGMIQRDMRKAQRARDVLREIPMDELMTRVGGRRRALHERHAADGRRLADARRVRAGAVGHHRAARAHVPREHEEERVRPRRDAQHPDVADARPRLRRAGARLRRRARRADQLPGPESRRRPGAAVEFTGRAHAVAADHPAADRSRAQARARRNRGRRIAWSRRSSRPAFRARRSRCIRDWATSARRCSRAARAA